jgi:hypothetical protein
MEEPRVFFATVLRDPLSEVIRKERVYLLGTSIVGIAILKTGLIPTKITALGIEFRGADQAIFLSLLGLVVLYFLAAFVVYAISDFLAWWEGYQAAWHAHFATDEIVLEGVLDEEPAPRNYNEDNEEFDQRLAEVLPSLMRRQRTRRIGLIVATIRAVLEYLLPVLVGAYAAYILILYPGFR